MSVDQTGFFRHHHVRQDLAGTVRLLRFRDYTAWKVTRVLLGKIVL
jgi:hypothetical protein